MNARVNDTAPPTPAMIALCRNLAEGFEVYPAAARLILRRVVIPSSATTWGRYEFAGTIRRPTMDGAIGRGLVAETYQPHRFALTDAGRALAGQAVPA